MPAISSSSDVQRLEFGIAQIELLNDEFAVITLSYLTNKYVIDVIHQQMRNEGYSSKIIDRTYLEKIAITSEGEADIYIISDYESETSFDVSSGREYGTKTHDVYPLKEGGWLSFLINGKRIFAKHTRPTGIKGTHFIEDTIIEKAELIQQEYYMLEQKWTMERLGANNSNV